MKNYKNSRLFVRKFVNAVLLLATVVFFSENVLAQNPCGQPINPTVMTITTSGATITWTAPAETPWHGYDYWYTTIQGYFPPAGPTPSGNTTSTSVTFNQFTSGATIYVYIRSRCGTQSGLNPSQWKGPISFTTLQSGAGCPNGQYGVNPAQTFTPAYTGSPEVITTQGYAGQFSRVNVMENRQYVFSSSVSTDYITITADNAAVVAHGQSPLTYNSYYDETLRFYTTTNSSCGTQQTNRTRSVQAQLIPSNCGAPNNLYTTSITHESAKILWTDTTPAPSTGFQYYYDTNPATPNINATPDGNTTSSFVTVDELNPNTTYYYWVRTVCGDDLTNWVSGGSFTTQPAEVIGCTGAIYGQMPSSTFTPACSGSPEIMSTNAWGGSYSEIVTQPNKIYTVESSVATDFFTIRDSSTSVGYASGTTPLVWSSGANVATIRVFLHTNSSCGSQIANRTLKITCQNATSCAAPGSISFPSVSATSAQIKWVAASPAPANGYQYYYNTLGTAPTTSTPPSGTIDSTTLYLTGLQNMTTYYFWVRANCGSVQSTWISGSSFSTVGPNGGCITALQQYPSSAFTPTCFGNNEIIVTDAQAGEHSLVNVSANKQYTFTSSVTSDYITITNADATFTYIKGYTPLVWNSGSSAETVRYYLHTNPSCGTSGSLRTRYVACQSAQACGNISGITFTNISITGAMINWMAANPAPLAGYQYYLSTQNTAPQSGTPASGSATSTSVSLSSLTASTTYYVWVRSNCVSELGAWISGGSFTTNAEPFCNVAEFGQFPAETVIPSCSGAPQLIADNAYAGE